MKKLNILAISLLITLTMYGQKDPAALKLLDEVAQKALSHKTMEAKFEYTIENLQEKTEENYSGTVMVKGKKFSMEVDETLTVCDGKSRWVYLKQSNEVNVSNVIEGGEMEPEERFMNDPLSLYSFYKKGFKYLLNGEEQLGEKKYQVIDLSPEDLNKPYFKIRCWISPDKELYLLKYFQKDGTRIALKFSDVVVDRKFKDSEFVFDVKAHPGIEVIDLRE